MIVATDAIPIKSMRYRESSRIVTLYTREFGKISGLAKGVRNLKSRFGGALEPLTCSRVVLYRSEQRDLHLLSQADIIDPFRRLHDDIDRMTVAFGVAELLLQIVHGEERHPALFDLTRNALHTINTARGDTAAVLHAFSLRMAATHGFQPDLDRCVSCGTVLVLREGGAVLSFIPARGGAVCRACLQKGTAETVHAVKPHGGNIPGRFSVQEESLRIRPETVQVLRDLLRLPMEQVAELRPASAVGNELEEVLRLYLRVHFGELRPLRSKQMTAGLPGDARKKNHHEA